MNKDSITKKLFEDKEVFASFINGVIYQGKKILSSHHLKEINLSTISDSFKERIRDIVQVYQTGDEIFSLYHIESQSVVDFSMVFCMMEYQAELYLKNSKRITDTEKNCHRSSVWCSIQEKRNGNSTGSCMNVFSCPARSNHGSATISCMCLAVPRMRSNLIIWI